MTTENLSQISIPVEGPFIVKLSRPLKPGLTTIGLKRYILGGPEGSNEILPEVMDKISAIDESLSFRDYLKAAGEIFNAHGLQTIDH